MSTRIAGMQNLIPFDPYSYDFHEDPFPTYARLRAEAPVYYNDAQDFWALAKHADISEAFRDNLRLSNSWGVSMDPASYNPNAHFAMSLLAMDDPQHLRMRKLVSAGFSPRRVAEMAERIAEISEEHWQKCLAQGEFDYVTDYAGKVPMDVVSELMGVPKADRAILRQQSDLLIHREEGVYDVPPEAITAYLHLVSYYRDLLADRRKNLNDDLVSTLITAELTDDDGQLYRLSDDEIIGFMILMIVAGNETTTKLLANAVYWADKFPEQKARLLSDPSLTPAWTEETLRFDNSTQLLLRRVLEDVDYQGFTLPAGDRVLLLLGSANRDPEVFEQPDDYLIGRDTGRALLSFGVGTHFCLGAHLARLEANIGLRGVLDSVNKFSIDHDRVERVHSVNVRGFAHLPMKVVTR